MSVLYEFIGRLVRFALRTVLEIVHSRQEFDYVVIVCDPRQPRLSKLSGFYEANPFER